MEMVEELIYRQFREDPLVPRWKDDYGRRGGVLGFSVSRALSRIED